MKNILICLFCCLLRTSAREFKLGMLSPYSHIRLGWQNNAAAVTLAIERAKSEGLLHENNISIIWRDDKCSALGGSSNAVYLRLIEDIDVFIGPPCSSSTTSSGLLATYWNIPMFSQASTDPSLADKSVYKTLIRLGPPFNKLGQALVEIFRHFNWNRVVIVSRRKTDNKRVFCDYSSRAADVVFRANNITVAEWMIIDDGITDAKIDEMLERIYQRGRIVILCSENKEDTRRILLRGKEAGMMDGRFVFWMPDQLPPANVEKPWLRGDSSDADAKLVFRNVFQITVAEMAGPEVESFRDLIPLKMAEAPWFYNTSVENRNRGSEYSPFLHDVVYLYLLTLNETLAEGSDPRNGTAIAQKARNKTFRGVTGNVKLDLNGDREPDYWVWHLNPDADKFTVVMEARMTTSSTKKIHVTSDIIWPTIGGLVPVDEPICGFTGDLCIKQTSHIVTVVVPVVMVIFFLILLVPAVIVYRRIKFQREVEKMSWKIESHEVKLSESRCIGSIGQMSHTSSFSALSLSKSRSEIGEGQIFTKIGYYKDTLVAVKRLPTSNLKLNREQQIELKTMKDLQHENINSFIGLCFNTKFTLFLTVYCSKGSLQDVIENDDIKLDWIFKLSLMTDIINGLNYIHHSPLKVHSNLKSSNCLVDNRWVLKLTDFGMTKNSHLKKNSTSGHQFHRDYFWTAPEVLRHESHVTRQADIYSFGIILYELVLRIQPYETTFNAPKDIIEVVRNGSCPPLRPNTSIKDPDDNSGIPVHIIQLMEACWDEEPDNRPEVGDIKKTIIGFNNGRKANIVDNMIVLLERYANNLEDIVDQRTSELIQERHKSDMLLKRMLPTTIAEKLKKNENVVPEMYESVSIYFSDIVGFTAIANISTAIQIVDLLNELYTLFDNIISRYDVYKVETIGDAYMVVSGLPEKNGDRHITEIADMSLDILQEIESFKIPHLPEEQCAIRIGLHTGPCAAGVVGLIMPRYCLFGDTVNMASRMESNGQASRIHISSATALGLQTTQRYCLCERGELDVKGKGKQTTYWLLGKLPNKNNNDCQQINII